MNFWKFMYVCVCAHKHMWKPYVPYVCMCLQKTEDDIGVEDGVGAGSWTETLWRTESAVIPQVIPVNPQPISNDTGKSPWLQKF